MFSGLPYQDFVKPLKRNLFSYQDKSENKEFFYEKCKEEKKKTCTVKYHESDV